MTSKTSKISEWCCNSNLSENNKNRLATAWGLCPQDPVCNTLDSLSFAQHAPHLKHKKT